MPGAGKTSACQFLVEKGFSVLRFGDQTDIGLHELDLPLTEENERMYREKIRNELGMAAYAIKIKPRIEKVLPDNEKIALDGLYSWEEFIYLKKYFPDLILLCIYARPDVRHKRLDKRKVRGLSLEMAKKRDYAEVEKLNKGGPIAIADYLVINNGSVKEFEKSMTRFLNFLNSR